MQVDPAVTFLAYCSKHIGFNRESGSTWGILCHKDVNDEDPDDLMRDCVAGRYFVTGAECSNQIMPKDNR